MNLAPYQLARNLNLPIPDGVSDQWSRYHRFLDLFAATYPPLFVTRALPSPDEGSSTAIGLYSLPAERFDQWNQGHAHQITFDFVPDKYVVAAPLTDSKYLLFPEEKKRTVFSFFLPRAVEGKRTLELARLTFVANLEEEKITKVEAENDRGCALGIWGEDDLFVCLDKGCKKNGDKCRLRRGYKGRAVIMLCRCE